MITKPIIFAGAMALIGSGAMADCENTVPVKSLTNAFPAYVIMTDVMKGCGNFEAELDKDHRLKVQDVLSSDPALYTIVGVANATSVPLFDQELVRPLNDLIEKHGQNLNENQFITIDGNVLAVAALFNTQHLMYREDIFNDLEIEVPTTWDEVFEAAETIEAAGLVDYPLGGYYMAGWNLGFVFVNHYLGEGGAFLDENNNPIIDADKAYLVMERMKTAASYMDPEYLVSDTTFVTKQFQQGKIAIANLWASRAGAVNDPNESTVAGKIKMAAGLMGSAQPASTVWWDGWVVAKNITDEEAEAGFKLIAAAMDPAVIAANNDAAVWLANGFTPGLAAVGAAATAEAGAPAYPATKAMAVMHTALGNGLSAYMTGDKDAETALADILADYEVAAKEANLL
ncbi:MAG: extracellular solute-binding protein [Albidovulum sp.]|nr:extracellular solute-binding protein [Albidovulum sp.]